MRYLSESAIYWSINELSKNVHPFFGITFLVCKKLKLPVGKTMTIKLDGLTKEYLSRHHRTDSKSNFFFQPFKSNTAWVTGKYPSSGLQAINTQTFEDVFLHTKRSPEWGFKETYIDKMHTVLGSLSGYDLISLPAIAIWTGKDLHWEEDTTIRTVIGRFLATYNITDLEQEKLFATTNSDEIPDGLISSGLLTEKPPDIKAISYRFGIPPDIPMDNEGTLSTIRLEEVGPASRMDLEFGNRISLIAGDNGLGKSFLLEVVWWAITGSWVTMPAMPLSRTNSAKSRPKITYEFQSDINKASKVRSYFEWKNNSWITSKNAPTIAAVCIYARVDGSFAVSDEIRSKLRSDAKPYGEHFTSDEVWDGKPGVIEGLIRDWVSWQLSPDKASFDKLVKILNRLSPDDLGFLEPGLPTRIPRDPRLIPTIRHPYGEVPILFASAGVQQILLLTYVILWTWQEHIIAASQINENPFRRMVIVIDEIEAHLHPRWQRSILPALIDIGKLLNENLELQIIASTHSPMVLASLESGFSESSDVLYHLALNGSKVELNALPFHKHGDISSWLTSPVFGLRHARSRDAEMLIEKAKSVQLSQNPNVLEIRSISNSLRRLLSPDDPFWPRWVYFAERSGIEL